MPVSEQGLPDWLLPVARAARTIEPRQLSRFLPPENGSGRQSAVLVLFGEGPPTGRATARGRGPAPTGEPAWAPAPADAPDQGAATAEAGAAGGPAHGAYAGARHPEAGGTSVRDGDSARDGAREPERAREAAVSAPVPSPPFVGPGGPELLLMERAGTLRSHAGQPSFPGGALDPEDGDPAGDGPLRAALREAEEETGLDPSGVQLFGVLPRLYIPVSEFVVTPVLGWWRRPSPVAPVDPAETARVFTVPVAELTDPANRAVAVHPSGHRGPAFLVGGALVWGFTAGVIDRILHFAGWERPWDRERHVPLDWRA
ncbi:CoA pyrophosphatase [Streptomyces sp. 71268]|uniref:NUDIX hydrolase n=1 Tax=Streptomyces sp. 71268 TaxID=3002640 RepID=UPI0023F950DF|nr:CoA pyrophosphatase [Streptomyces sp. 71268]WEV26802.1 CoA pyrophosphatase [Streptomyces sp. 71268]